jgi:hypothetical protein
MTEFRALIMLVLSLASLNAVQNRFAGNIEGKGVKE